MPEAATEETVENEVEETPNPKMPEATTTQATTTQVFTRDQVDDLVTRARREEKDKLYDDIERSRREAKQAAADLDAIKAKQNGTGHDNTDAAKLKEQLEAQEKKVDEIATKMSEAMDAALNAQKADFEVRLEKQRLDAFRENLIASANGEVIPELITGKTEDEIKASFELSKQRFQQIAEKAASKIQEANKGALPKPVTPGTTGQTVTDEDSPDSLRHLSAKEWDEQKLARKQKAFEQAGLPMKVR